MSDDHLNERVNNHHNPVDVALTDILIESPKPLYNGFNHDFRIVSNVNDATTESSDDSNNSTADILPHIEKNLPQQEQPKSLAKPKLLRRIISVFKNLKSIKWKNEEMV